MNRKGTAMVEAAVVFPMVILTVMALIYMFQIFLEKQKYGPTCIKRCGQRAGSAVRRFNIKKTFNLPFRFTGKESGYTAGGLCNPRKEAF